MSTLIEKLNEFGKKAKDLSNEAELQKLFEDLAPAFLYGGYIQVRNEYKVYIRTVEFYFHSEKDNGIHDPIVYHRNGRGLKKVPYFPIMSLNAHNSGYDITFESKDNYRASALIRSYEVISIEKENKNEDCKYLEWNKKGNMFTDSKERKNITQSTYLYYLINGFSICKDNNENNTINENNRIIWVDESLELKNTCIKSYKRANVPLYRPDGNDYIKITKDFYHNNRDYVENLHPELKKSEPHFFTSGKDICLQDPKLWQFRIDEIKNK
ncbi:MAG: hypothetical protein IJK62_15095 [Bacteroidales bacterium]|nr:hypothetical protein [Bacteroidales bacterium]